MVKYTTSGRLVWRKRYELNDSSGFYDASADSTGNLYLAGSKQTNLDGSGSSYVIKLGPNGTRLWNKRVTSSSDYSVPDRAHAILVRTGTEVYVAGITFANYDGDGFLRRMRGSDGGSVWTD